MIRLVAVILALVLGICVVVLPSPSRAQTPLPLGSVNNFAQHQTCPTINGGSFNSGTICYSGTVGNCQNLVSIGFTYGVLNAAGSAGTIVFFNGSDGTDIGFNQDALSYSNQGFQTIQVVWQSASGGPAAWEQAGSGTAPTSIKDAACRPATLLHWIRCGNSSSNNCPANVTNIYTGGGMCAQGASAGSAAIAYSLAEYGAGNYLDNVELMSGPVLSDIQKGCSPSSLTPTVCTGTGNDSYCKNGGEGGWQAPLNYQPPANGSIDYWTALTTNRNSPVACTVNTTYNSQFKQMSIVDGITGSGADATFSYPHTAMGGWLCAYSSSNSVCTSATNPSANNSPVEGELFYTHVAANPLNVYRVDGCASNSEGIEVPGSMVPASVNGSTPCSSGQSVLQADMVTHCVAQTH